MELAVARAGQSGPYGFRRSCAILTSARGVLKECQGDHGDSGLGRQALERLAGMASRTPALHARGAHVAVVEVTSEKVHLSRNVPYASALRFPAATVCLPSCLLDLELLWLHATPTCEMINDQVERPARKHKASGMHAPFTNDHLLGHAEADQREVTIGEEETVGAGVVGNRERCPSERSFSGSTNRGGCHA